MQYTSSQHTIPYAVEKVYTKLADMRNLEQSLDKLPEGVPQIAVIDSERCDIQLPMGFVLTITYKEKEPPHKLVITNAPLPLPLSFELVLHLAQLDEETTTIQLELEATIPLMAQGIVGNDKLKKGVDKMAQLLAQIPYA